MKRAAKERKHRTQAHNASTNGGDASRVGGREERKELNTNATTAHNSCIFSRRGTRRPH